MATAPAELLTEYAADHACVTVNGPLTADQHIALLHAAALIDEPTSDIPNSDTQNTDYDVTQTYVRFPDLHVEDQLPQVLDVLHHHQLHHEVKINFRHLDTPS